MKKGQTIYYTDELHDEFSDGGITARRIDENYDYGGHGLGWKAGHIFWYYCIIIPFARVYMKLHFGHRVVGREKLPRKSRGERGIFLYGNHTNQIPDAFIPTLLVRPRDMYVIVHPDNVSMPVLGRITPYLGALPLPDDSGAMRKFMKRIKEVILGGEYVTIYPEAHIWPYYTGIRPFPAASFGYPLSLNAPVYCFTNTYQKRGGLFSSSRPRIVTYVDGPFYGREGLSNAERKQDLRDRVYETMCERAKSSNVELIHYVKKETET